LRNSLFAVPVSDLFGQMIEDCITMVRHRRIDEYQMA